MFFKDKTQTPEFLAKLRSYLKNDSPTNPTPVLEASNWQAFKLFLGYLLPYTVPLLVGIAAVFIGSGIDGFLIYRIKFIVNGGNDGSDASGILDTDALTSFALLLIVLMTIRALMQFLSTFLFS